MTRKSFLRRFDMIMQAYRAGILTIIEAHAELRKLNSELEAKRVNHENKN